MRVHPKKRLDEMASEILTLQREVCAEARAQGVLVKVENVEHLTDEVAEALRRLGIALGLDGAAEIGLRVLGRSRDAVAAQGSPVSYAGTATTLKAVG